VILVVLETGGQQLQQQELQVLSILQESMTGVVDRSEVRVELGR